jgi:hypothetical protein
VVFSRTRATLLLVALVVAVMALGIMGVLRAVSASPDNNDHTTDQGRSTLTISTKTREIKVVDLGPRGTSHGDIRAGNAPIYNESGKQRIGRLDLFCVTTDPADEPAEKAHMAECTLTYTLPGGEVSAQGVERFPKTFFEPPPGGVNAITGGTGKYAGVRGELRFGFETRGNRGLDTFHFID